MTTASRLFTTAEDVVLPEPELDVVEVDAAVEVDEVEVDEVEVGVEAAVLAAVEVATEFRRVAPRNRRTLEPAFELVELRSDATDVVTAASRFDAKSDDWLAVPRPRVARVDMSRLVPRPAR